MSVKTCSDPPCYSIMDYYHYKSLQFALVGEYDDDDDHRDNVSNDSEITLVQAPTMDDDNEKKVPKDHPTCSSSTIFFSAAADHLKARFKQALAQATTTTTTNNKKASNTLLKKRWFFHSILSHKRMHDQEQQHMKKKIRYQKKVTVHDTYSQLEYNREPDPMAACLFLTPATAGEIKRELNLFKSTEMEVHPDSQMYTHYLV